MGRLRTITRRTFLIGSATIAGGVVFGTYLAKRPIKNPLLSDLQEGEGAITPYVKIDANGVTLITPRADKGQGAYSMQAQLIAEELDIDPAIANLSPGMPGPAYYNGVVMEESVPFPAYDKSAMAENVRKFMHVPAKLLAMQITGGSSTVPDGFVKLRMAGAIARETLKEAAALQSGITRDQLKTEDGFVVMPDGTRLSYTELASDAASIEPVTEVELRSQSEWKYLGKPMQRIDMPAKCTGTEKYGIDVSVKGMVHAAVRANPGLGAKMESFDASIAESMRGVQKVLPVENGIAVIADNTWRAWRAVDAIDIKWAAGPYPAGTQEIFAEIEKAVNSEEHRDHRQRDDGDVTTALEEGDNFEAVYKVPYLAHAPMEPMNAIVKVTDDQCEIWTGTQIPLFVRDHAAEMTGLDKDMVFVYVQPMGGSFGHKLEDTHVLQAVEIAKAMKGTAVKLVWSREEDMTHDYLRPGAVAKGRGKVVDGKVEAFDLSVGQSGLMADWFGRLMGMNIPGPDATITTGSWDQRFAIPNYRVTGYRAPVMVPISSWRSVGASGNGFFHDSLLDELIHKADADPLAERIRLCLDDTSRKVLEKVGEISGWNGSFISENRGRGVAFCLSFGVPTAIVTEVTHTDVGIKIDRVFVVVDVGDVLDPINLEAQVFGGVIFGMAHAMNCETTFENHTAQQDNYHAFEGMRLYQVPEFEIVALSNAEKIRGIGEPGVPPSAPSLGNAIFAATGRRIRELPFNKQIDFV